MNLLGKLETIIALSSIIGLGALLLQNKKAIGDFSREIKKRLTFTSPLTPLPEKLDEQNTKTIPPTDLPPTDLPPTNLPPTDLPPTDLPPPVKRFEQPQIIFTPPPIVPPPTVNRGAEIIRPQGTTSIQGTVRSEIQTDQKFNIFSADSSQTPRGVIRQTKQNPKALRVDSRNRPRETASQRANRVFRDTGNFADEDRGATKFSSRKKFNFGTNTGRGGTTPTTLEGGERKSSKTQRSAKLSRSDRLKIEAEKARKIFDSRSISNF